MINLLIIFGILLFSEIDAATPGKANSLLCYSNDFSKQKAISELTLCKEKFQEKERQERNISYFRVLIQRDHPLMITKFPATEGKEGIVSVSKLTELIYGFKVNYTKTFKYLMVSAGERVDVLDNIEMQTSLVLYPNTSNSMFKINVWTAFGYPECDCEEGFMNQKEFDAATTNTFRII